MAMGTGPVTEGMADVLHLYRTGDLAEAEARCRVLVERDPHCGEAWDRLARIAERQGDPARAVDHYRRAVAELSHPAEAHNNLAVLLQRRGDFEEALTHYRRAVALGLRHALLHSNLGCLLRDLGYLQDGAEELARALAIDPSSAHAHSNLGVTLALQGELARALQHLRRAVALQPDWDLAQGNLLFCLNYADDLSPAQVAAPHLAFGRRHPEPELEAPPLLDAGAAADPERKLRVGFVSPDLKQHSIAYFLEPILGAYDRDAFTIICYADVIRPDGVTDRMRAAVDGWRSIRGLADADVARLVRADRIDILIDLAGHTANNRMALFATRVAPVQMTYLGYPNTTGLETVDWRITDEWADPPGMTEPLHSEELLRLRGGFLCFRPRAASPDPTPPPARALGRVTFGSFNLPAKISPTSIGLWAEILRRVPGARLCLKGPAFADPATRAAFQRRLAASALAGHDVELWSHFADERDHLAAYGRIDVALDTWPYGGTTTTCEALWMGVPVVTLAGRSHASRVGASLLTRLGQPALIADSGAGYVATAVDLVADLDRLAALRASLRGRMIASGITDEVAFSNRFAEGLRRAWRIRCEKARAARRPPPPETTTAPLVGNLRVVVPDTLEQITSYVLLEQHDWFEDEIGYVRAALARGERAIDIGANHGVYALSMARRVGLSGQVWAFEPGRAVAARLRASVALNGLPQTTVIEAALTNREGEGELVGAGQSELGRLAPEGTPPRDATPAGAAPAHDDAGQGRQMVALLTLDGCRARLGLRDVAFVKIDAEGAEGEIIAGGQRFFAEESPLVMFEVRQDATLDLELVVRFQRLGYQPYRLIPGLGILAPLGEGRTLDPFTLNLFACKAERAGLLETRGLLATVAPPAEPRDDAPAGAWTAYLRAQSFAAAIWPRWSDWIAAQGPDAVDRAYLRALDHYAVAQRITEPPGVRCAALAAALQIVSACVHERPTIPLLQTLARVTCDAGERAIAAGALNLLIERCASATDADVDLPFLAVSPRFDELPAREEDGELIRWVTAAALEQRERLRAFSSFYTARDPATRACLEAIAALGYGSPEMARRLELVKSRRG